MESTNEVADRDKWGYVVCFGTVIIFVAGIGHVNSFGLIYKDFIEETHSSVKSLTTANGIFAMMLALGGSLYFAIFCSNNYSPIVLIGIILNIISKRFSLKHGGLIGSLIFIFGSFTTILISSTNQLTITFGVLQGIGFGMVVPVCYSTLNKFFVKKRTMVTSVAKAIQGLILVWYPQLLKKILSLYGIRGTLLIISGISLHMLPGIMIMNDGEENKTANKRTANNLESGKESENKELINETEHITPVNILDTRKYQDVDTNRFTILDSLSLKLLKDPVYCDICLGQSFVNFSDITFFVLQPMLLFQYEFDKMQVVTCISICAGADVAGRFALAIISSIVTVNTRVVLYIATLFTLLFRIVILQVRTFVWVSSITAVLGALRAWLHVASPLVISDYVPHEDFPGAYALFLLATGLVNLAVAPLVGLLKDVYQDYIPAFYALAACCMPCLLLWPIEYLITKRTAR